jgi:hypothetical protein
MTESDLIEVVIFDQGMLANFVPSANRKDSRRLPRLFELLAKAQHQVGFIYPQQPYDPASDSFLQGDCHE